MSTGINIMAVQCMGCKIWMYHTAITALTIHVARNGSMAVTMRECLLFMAGITGLMGG